MASVVVGFSMYAQSLIVPQLLQLPKATGFGLGQSMLAAGLWMAPCGLMMMALSPVGARLSAARGPKVTLIVGSLIIAGKLGGHALPSESGFRTGMLIGCAVALLAAVVALAIPSRRPGAVREAEPQLAVEAEPAVATTA
jgi:hypothetical protein